MWVSTASSPLIESSKRIQSLSSLEPYPTKDSDVSPIQNAKQVRKIFCSRWFWDLMRSRILKKKGKGKAITACEKIVRWFYSVDPQKIVVFGVESQALTQRQIFSDYKENKVAPYRLMVHLHSLHVIGSNMLYLVMKL